MLLITCILKISNVSLKTKVNIDRSFVPLSAISGLFFIIVIFVMSHVLVVNCRCLCLQVVCGAAKSSYKHTYNECIKYGNGEYKHNTNSEQPYGAFCWNFTSILFYIQCYQSVIEIGNLKS